jgi:hypothetical protein
MLEALSKRLATNPEEADSRLRTGAVNLHGETDVNPYHRVFTQEAMLKLGLAWLRAKHPDTAVGLLNPEGLADIPEALGRFIATDIANDPNSLVMNFMLVKRKALTNFHDYLRDNEMSQPAKEMGRAIGLGAQAVGARSCPMNDLGICRGVADRIEVDNLPREIQEDMQKKRLTAADRLASQLLQFGKQNKVSAWWSMDAVVSAKPSNGHTNQTNGKSGNPAKRGKQTLHTSAATPKGFLESLASPISKEITGPSRVQVSLAGRDEIAEASSDAVEALDQIIETIITSKKFADYLQDYRHDKTLQPFVTEALREIFIAPYGQVRAIRKVAERANAPHITEQNERLIRYRLSGKDYPGFSGAVVRSTRIEFAIRNQADARRVEIIGINHKTAIEKQSKSGRLFRR